MNYAKREKDRIRKIKQKAKVDAILNKINSLTKSYSRSKSKYSSLVIINGITLGYFNSSEWLEKVKTKDGLNDLYNRVINKNHYFNKPKLIVSSEQNDILNSFNKD